MRHLIIGNGVAGVCAAEAIRERDPDASITMIARESFPPYSRPMISLVLEGVASLQDLAIRPPSFYRDLRIDPVVGESAVEVDLARSRVRTDKDRVVPFDRLLIATGGDPKTIQADGCHLDNIFFMRTQGDVRRMLLALPQARSALVLGGGLVGFKASYGFLHQGLPVTLIISSRYPLSMLVDPPAGLIVLDELKRKGLQVRVGVDVVAFDGVESVSGAHLSDGRYLPCDMVVIAKGVSPALSFVPPEIKTNRGILVDGRLQTSVPGVHAAGDVAESVDVARQARTVNALWPVAAEQGWTAGANMAGEGRHYRGSLSRNVIRIFSLDLLTAGIVNPSPEDGCTSHALHDGDRRIYRKLVMRGDTPVGMVMVNQIEQGGILISLIQEQRPLEVPAEEVISHLYDLRAMVT